MGSSTVTANGWSQSGFSISQDEAMQESIARSESLSTGRSCVHRRICSKTRQKSLAETRTGNGSVYNALC